jgi:hypothetical protein
VVSVSLGHCSARRGEHGDVHRTGTRRARVGVSAVEHVGFVARVVHPPGDDCLLPEGGGKLGDVLGGRGGPVTRVGDGRGNRRSIAAGVVERGAGGGEVVRLPVGGGLQLGVLGEGVTRGCACAYRLLEMRPTTTFKGLRG